MRLLVVHQNFPGQFRHLVSNWNERAGWQVKALGRDTAPSLRGFGALVRYHTARRGRDVQHPYLRRMESATLHGQAALRAMLGLRQQGFQPDVIVAHPGWGETLYAKEAFPDARLLHYCEWYYSTRGADVDFDPEFPATLDDRARVRTWNALHALNLTQCDAGVSPTPWQRSQHPDALRSKIAIQHEGIPSVRLHPDRSARIVTPSGVVLTAGDPVITYVARNLEPYRGFHVFMRALQIVQRTNARAHAVIVGADGVSYGRLPDGARTWRERLLREVKLDPTRTHFLGQVPYDHYTRVLQVSAAHVYLTYPFVLSWSLLEAMATGALVVASDTAPVRDIIRRDSNGLLVPFFEPATIARCLHDALSDPAQFTSLRERARQDAAAFDERFGLEGYDRLIGTLASA